MNEFFTCPQSGLVRNLTVETARWNHRQEQIRLASIALRQAEIHRIMARYELESDEFYTAEEKAKRYL